MVLDRGQIDDWFKSGMIVAFATIAAASFMFFIPWELTHPDPIVDIRLLCRRQFGMSFLVMLTVGAILFGSNQIMPQLLQTGFPYTAELSGLAIMPGGLAMLVMMPIAGQVTGLMQPKYWIALGLGAIALAMWYSTSLTPDASFGYFAMVRVFQMIGLPFLFIPINTIAYDGLPQDKTNEGSALINVARNLGGSIGVSLANTELAAAQPVPSGAAGRKHGAVIAGVPVDSETDHAILHAAGRPAVRCAVSCARLHRPTRQRTGVAHGLYRRVPHLGHICCNTRSNRAAADTARTRCRARNGNALRRPLLQASLLRRG